eukprot:scaffold322686_cov30-Tisochrysis_lutea.AAC.1
MPSLCPVLSCELVLPNRSGDTERAKQMTKQHCNSRTRQLCTTIFTPPRPFLLTRTMTLECTLNGIVRKQSLTAQRIPNITVHKQSIVRILILKA